MDGDSEESYSVQEDNHEMSERVQSLAASIYKELERMIKKYDEDVVKELMPLVVGILENLDSSYSEKRETEVELELLRDDNEQLITQYEREKQLRKASEKKYLEVEDAIEEERKEMESKIESLESIVRMFELKSRNSQDHITRLEDKESEMRKEYNKLHERYTELFKTHMDYLERTKILMGGDRLIELNTVANKKAATFTLPGMKTANMNIYNNLDLQTQNAYSPTNSLSKSNITDNSYTKNELSDLDTNLNSRERKDSQNKNIAAFTEMVTSEMVTDTIMVFDRNVGTSDKLPPSLELEEMDDTDYGGEKVINKNESSIFDEITFHDQEALGEMDDGVDITGMGREVENLILENTELLATKNALNVVKDDLIAKVDELTSELEIMRGESDSWQAVKTKLKSRIADLEDDLKKLRDDLEKAKTRGGNENEDEDIPMAQRKRFTRVEMARVLMERNQYKERLMELQEAVRWTEMIRASREHPDVSAANNKKKSSLWNIFSNLFQSPNKPRSRTMSGTASIKYSAPTTKLEPAGDPNKNPRENYNLGEKGKAYDFLQDDILTEKKRKEREKERREQYKQVQVHVRKDDGRMQAYGWSLPAKFQPPSSHKENSGKAQVPVPVPVYCRPLNEKDQSTKIWCAAGVHLGGGKLIDGYTIGSSIFYNNQNDINNRNKIEEAKDNLEKLDNELKDFDDKVKKAESEQTQLSSMVWICTTSQNASRVTVVDGNHPADILETFKVTSSHVLCIASVPGANDDDYPANDEALKADITVDDSVNAEIVENDNKETNSEFPEGTNIGNITFVQCATGTTSKDQSADSSPVATPSSPSEQDVSVKPKVIKTIVSAVSNGSEDFNDNNDNISSTSCDNDFLYVEVGKPSSVQPTMWLGTQSGSLYVHSSVSHWKKCLHSVKLKDSILSICHVRGRVVVALADGTVAFFHRATGGKWDLLNYHIVDLGKPHHSIRCMCVVANKDIWCGYRNRIHVLDPKTLRIEKSFDAHPRKESQVRQLAWIGDGVWVSIRLDSTLRLYHAYTYQHLQDVDIEPYVSKMLGTGKLGFSFVRITSLLISCSRLWIGTGNGVIISVPLSETTRQSLTACSANRPGGVIRVYSDVKSDNITPGSFIPYCSMAQAQLSFHGHRDAVKFFVAVPGSPQQSLSGQAELNGSKDSPQNSKDKNGQNMLVISGGEGYIDFRLAVDAFNGNSGFEGETEEDDINLEKKSLSKGDKSHLIIWQVFTNS